MGKLQRKPRWSPKRKNGSRVRKPQDDVLIIHPNPNPTLEQIARSEALGRHLDEMERRIANMTPEQRRKADDTYTSPSFVVSYP